MHLDDVHVVRIVEGDGDPYEERMAHFKCPAAVELGELPKTSTGKVRKFVLREKEWQGHAKRIH